MSQMNEEAEGSNVVGDGKVDTNPTGVKMGATQRRKGVEDMKQTLKERAARIYNKEKKAE